jgi:hypothetical protein
LIVPTVGQIRYAKTVQQKFLQNAINKVRGSIYKKRKQRIYQKDLTETLARECSLHNVLLPPQRADSLVLDQVHDLQGDMKTDEHGVYVEFDQLNYELMAADRERREA